MVPQIWEDFLTIIREEVGSRVVETWFKAVSLRQWDPYHGAVYLEVPNSFVREWIKSNYMGLMQFHLGRLLGVHEPKIVLLDTRDQERKESSSHNNGEGDKADIKKSEKTTLIKASATRPICYINKNHSFDSLVVGPHNALAYAAAYSVAERPGQVYNPLFIWSSSGLGKTHLLHAIGNRIKMIHKKSVVLYQATERFVNEFVHAVRFDKVQQFHAKYQQIDVLLMDDVQFISRKEQSQEAFFQIFNSLYDHRKQIVFSGDMMPHAIEGLSERLKSRLVGGLITDIEEPLLETKIAILKRKAELNEETLDDAVAAYIASQRSTNIRELEGALVRVIAFASLTKQKVSLELARKILSRTHGALICKQPVDGSAILNVICRYYPYSVNELKSRGRRKDMAFVRHLSMFLVKKLTSKSLRDIGQLLGGRDHATVMHALNKIEQFVSVNPAFQETIRRIEIDIMRH